MGVWAFDGALRPDEVSELLGHHIAEDPEYDTIAGLITLHLGHIATVGDSVELETEAAHGYPAARVTFAVEAMDGARIARVHATATPLESQEDDR